MLKLIKRYLPFAIVDALIYLIMPIFFQGEKYVYDFIEYQFVFPATALITGLVFAWIYGLDFTLPLIPPIIFIGSVLIYSHYYHWHIYVFIYLILAMLGCFIGDMVYREKQTQQQTEAQEKKENPSYKIKLDNFTVITNIEENKKGDD